MDTRRLILLLVSLFSTLVLVGSALAMSSDHYRLDWFTLLAGSGGGATNSTHYALNLTIGQAVIGTSSGTNYGASLGYWCGTMAAKYGIYLPLVLRDSS